MNTTMCSGTGKVWVCIRKVTLALAEIKIFLSNTAMFLCVRHGGCGLIYKYRNTRSPNLPQPMKVQDLYLNPDPHLIFVSSQETVIEALKIHILWMFHLSQSNCFPDHHF